MGKRKIDILCVGEVLIDMIGDLVAQNLAQTKSFSKYVGGSPTNVAKNMAQLGLNATLVASIGDEGLGDFIINDLKTTNLDLQNLSIKKNQTTSIILVSRTLGTPEFIPYRQADYCIEENQISTALLKNSKIFHTTCFALSKNPAQTVILQKAREAFENGCQLSIDLNYAQKIWGDTKVLPILKSYCQFQPLVKLSEDDAFRIFNKRLSNNEIFEYFISLGAKMVCLTKGKEGSFIAQKNKDIIFMPAPKVTKIADATGAGDAFWSGFLAGYLKNLSLKKCLQTANNLVAIKIQHVGGLPTDISLEQIITK